MEAKPTYEGTLKKSAVFVPILQEGSQKQTELGESSENHAHLESGLATAYHQ
jgi:hypothetical protein